MAIVSVRRRVRPLRFAFLVQHQNSDALRKAIQLNTILWGGMFNPIIPIFTRTPRAWRTARTADEIVRGYLSAFEPDFVVVADGLDATRFGVSESTSVQLDAMLTEEGLGERGMGVMDIYRWRYEHEFRFVQRKPVPLLRPVASTTRLQLWASAVFGEYPVGKLEFFAKGFDDLGGEESALTAASYFESLRKSLSPLTLGTSGIEVRGAPGPRRVFLLLDPTSPTDLVDFWNLRALGWSVIGIPSDWATELAPAIKEIIREEHQPDTVLPAPFTRAHVLKSRAVGEDRLQTFANEVAAPPQTVVMQSWLPRLWEPEVRDSDRANRIDLSAGDSVQEVQVSDEWISFRTIGPEFEHESWVERPRYANVVDLHSFELPTLATLIPSELDDLDKLMRWIGPANMIRSSSEGIAVLTDRPDRGVTWRVPHGLRVFSEWFKPKGEVQLSGAGRMANRMLDLLGGPERARLVSSVELVNLFAGATGTASRDIPHKELFALLMKADDNRKEVAERRIEAMLRQKIIKLGMRLACERCAQQNWFALDELRGVMTCQWCLDTLPFPAAMPPKQPCWAYRPLGPFAAKGHAHGAYVVAAAIRTLRELGQSSRTTWVPSFTLKTADENLEADFGMYWEASGGRRFRPQLILGECKTYDRFDATDVKRMKRLSKIFPRSVMIFATFNDKLTPGEQKLIAPFAKLGRNQGWRSPVMVLTARELTSTFGFPFCWHHEGTEREKRMYQALVRAPFPNTSLRRLADATQQLHLGLEADENWPHYGMP